MSFDPISTEDGASIIARIAARDRRDRESWNNLFPGQAYPKPGDGPGPLEMAKARWAKRHRNALARQARARTSVH